MLRQFYRKASGIHELMSQPVVWLALWNIPDPFCFKKTSGFPWSLEHKEKELKFVLVFARRFNFLMDQDLLLLPSTGWASELWSWIAVKWWDFQLHISLQMWCYGHQPPQGERGILPQKLWKLKMKLLRCPLTWVSIFAAGKWGKLKGNKE